MTFRCTLSLWLSQSSAQDVTDALGLHPSRTSDRGVSKSIDGITLKNGWHLNFDYNAVLEDAVSEALRVAVRAKAACDKKIIGSDIRIVLNISLVPDGGTTGILLDHNSIVAAANAGATFDIAIVQE